MPTGQIKELISSYGESEDGYTVTSGKQCLTGAEGSIYYLVLNMDDATMQNADVRHAMSLAINRQNIVDTLFEGVRQPADNIFPPIIDSKANAWQYAKYDKDAAQKIMDEKGLAGTEITLSYNSGGGHEDNFIYPNFFSSADNNYSRYNNKTVDADTLAARQITDEEERKSAYRAINDKIAEDMPIIPIMFYSHVHLGSERIKSLYYDAQGKADLKNAELKA